MHENIQVDKEPFKPTKDLSALTLLCELFCKFE